MNCWLCQFYKDHYIPWDAFFNISKENDQRCWQITLSVKWAKNILKSLSWVKQRGATAKRAMKSRLYDELAFTWKKNYTEGFATQNLQESHPQF